MSELLVNGNIENELIRETMDSSSQDILTIMEEYQKQMQPIFVAHQFQNTFLGCLLSQSAFTMAFEPLKAISEVDKLGVIRVLNSFDKFLKDFRTEYNLEVN